MGTCWHLSPSSWTAPPAPSPPIGSFSMMRNPRTTSTTTISISPPSTIPRLKASSRGTISRTISKKNFESRKVARLKKRGFSFSHCDQKGLPLSRLHSLRSKQEMMARRSDESERAVMDNVLLGVVAFVGLFLLSLLGIGAMTSFSFLDVRAGANYLPYDSGRPIHIVWWTDNRHGDSRSALHLPQPWGRVEHNLTGLRAGEPFRCVVEGSREAATGMTDALLWEPVYRGAANLPAEVPPRFEHQLWVLE